MKWKSLRKYYPPNHKWVLLHRENSAPVVGWYEWHPEGSQIESGFFTFPTKNGTDRGRYNEKINNVTEWLCYDKSGEDLDEEINYDFLKWTHVDIELPVDNQKVLFMERDFSNYPWVGIYLCDKEVPGFRIRRMHGRIRDNVTYWMRIPDSPDEREREQDNLDILHSQEK